MEVPQGMRKWYGANIVILLLKTIYGLKQGAYAFWMKLLKAFRRMNFKRSKADPCLSYRWTIFGLIVWLTWVDDCLIVGPKTGVKRSKSMMMKLFKCDEVGPLQEYVGCKIDYKPEEGSLKFTQPVLLQSYEDEFDLPEGDIPNTPAEPGQVLTEGDTHEVLPPHVQKHY